MAARVVSLQLHRAKSEPPTPVDSVIGRVGGGFEGDSHVKKTTRSVLVVDRSTLADLGLAPGDLREQVTVEGLRELNALEPGTHLRIGGITLRVNGPCEPCTHIGGMLSDKDYPALQVAADILGSGFTSRLMRKVRTELGYAYSIGAGWGAGYLHPGLFEISGSTKSASTTETIEVIRRGDVRRAKLYYLRDRVGKATRIKEKRD